MSAARLRRVHAAVVRDLDELSRRDRDLARSSLAVSALALASIVDDADNSANARTMAARELRETMATLRELAPAEEPKASEVDRLRGRAAAKLKAAS